MLNSKRTTIGYTVHTRQTTVYSGELLNNLAVVNLPDAKGPFSKNFGTSGEADHNAFACCQVILPHLWKAILSPWGITPLCPSLAMALGFIDYLLTTASTSLWCKREL